MGLQTQSQLEKKILCPWPSSIKEHLEKRAVHYRIHQHEATVTLEQAAKRCRLDANCLVRGVVLSDDQGLIMAVIPANRLLDFSALCDLLRRDLQPVSPEKLRQIFRDCEPGSFPPVPDVYGLEPVIDQSVYQLPKIIFEPGIHQILIEMEQTDFQKLNSKVRMGKFAAQLYSLSNVDDEGNVSDIVKKFTPRRMQERVEQTFELPSLPPMASQILKLRVDPAATPEQLASILEKDPSLAAQLISWAQSPFYGYPGKVDSIETAIIKVLGFDLVMNLALGVVVGKAMKVPVEGPLGLKAYWRFSLYTATLVEKLLTVMPVDKRPPRGMAYLAGLLHNIGHLILGEVFPPQFFILNRYVMLNPHVSINKIEQHVLGVRHEQIGAWLMNAWHMPEEIIAAVKWHHQGEFVNENMLYANLVFVATRLLKTLDMGDASSDTLPDALLQTLGITEIEAKQVLEQLKSHRDELDALANQIT